MTALARQVLAIADSARRAKPADALKRLDERRKKAANLEPAARSAELNELVQAAQKLGELVQRLIPAGVGAGDAAAAPAGDVEPASASAAAPKVAGQPAAAPGPGPGPGTGPGGDVAAGPSGGTKAGITPEKVAYDKERAAVVKLRSDLGKHKQAAHVSDKTGQADAALTAAENHAKTPDWPKAMAELTSARTACADGKTFADGFADFLTKRAETNLVLTAAQTSGWTGLAAFPPLLASADTKAAVAARNYAGAKADCDSIITGLAPFFKKFYVDDVKPKITALKALPGAKFITAETAAIDKLMAQQETGITAKQWRQVRLNAGLIANQMAMAEKIAKRRTDFDVERPKLDPSIKALQARGKAVAAPLAAIEARLKEADAMASKAGMQFEDAKASVLEIAKSCDALDKLARDAEAYSRERAVLAAELSKLREHAAVTHIKAELDVLRGLLDEAAKAAGDKGAPGTPLVLGNDLALHDIGTANARLAQARTNLDTAKSLAAGLDGVAQMQQLTKGKANATEVRKALAALAAELESARKEGHADLAKKEYDAVAAALAEVQKKIDAKEMAEADKLLGEAGQQMVAGRRLQIEHAKFVERRDVLEKRLDQHLADKAQADLIKLKLDELAKALAEAEAAEGGGKHADAIAALNRAETAAAAADSAMTDRAAFDKEANAIDTELKKPEYAAIKVAQGTALTQARAKAFILEFAEANKMLKAIRNTLAASEADAMARKAPPDPKLLDKAKKLAEAGGTKELDSLIKSLPPTLDKQVFIDLAEARFKIDFEAEADGNEQASIKRMCELMKDIPDDVIGNPSLKKINRRVTKTDGSGGSQDFPYYVASTDEVVMNSRPGQWNKPDFEPAAAGRLPARDKDCEPANANPEDLFDFNMLHELAHSIDDAKNYMGTFGKNDDHGGWIAIGGAVEQIADAVFKATGFGKAGEERQYVLDCILRNPAVAPTTFTGDKATFETFIAAAQTNNVWDSQAVTDQATLGKRVYHEAYPNTWFSYWAEARKRGITSYQFRAPGEWFSELYAAWKVGKLKAGHPAESWLKKLKV